MTDVHGFVTDAEKSIQSQFNKKLMFLKERRQNFAQSIEEKKEKLIKEEQMRILSTGTNPKAIF